MIIKNAQIKDAAEILAIYAPYVENTAITFEHKVPTLQEFEERIRTISAKFPYIVAVDEKGAILGYAYASTFKARASYAWNVETSIYVKMDSKRNGIGRALYEKLEAELKEMGILNMNACIAAPKVEDKYLTFDSIKFHEKMGFTLVGTFHDSGYKFNNWYNMVWMEKMIGEHVTNQNPVKFRNIEI